MSDEKINQILDELSKPFHPSRITWRPGALTGKKDKALALAYADLRAYQNRLDETCGMDWSVSYTPWGDRIICHLTINGITRSSTGEAAPKGHPDAERSEIAGTSAEAQAFKRACAMFGLGRYLYSLPSLWVDYDAPNQRFTEKSKARLHSIIAQHYQRFLNGGDPRGAVATLDAPAEETPEDVQVAETARTAEETTSTEPVRQAQGQPAPQAQSEPTRPAATKSAPKQVKEAPMAMNGAMNGATNGPVNGSTNGPVNGPLNGATNGTANGNGSHAAENGEPQDEALLPLRKKLDELGKELYGEQWAHVRAHNIKRLVGEQTDGSTALSKEQMQTLINGLKKLQQQRQTA